ncbi:MAG TPA: MBL fold metallo-hydrolase, partial [Roseiflexaceae bacterium]|nr:MBL fold metallo-hydrolase [Roseiflexaceae bacterium]
DWLAVPEHERPPGFAQLQLFPTQCIHVALPNTSVLIDASRFDPAASPHPNPGYIAPPGLREALTATGVAAESIEHVVITHVHHDHFNAVTHLDSNQPCFPNARHYLGRADWQAAQAALGNPSSLESRTLGVLWNAELLELVDARREICESVAIIPAPGESPGHQIVRIQSGGQTLICIGDIYHHTLEVAHAAWVPTWANADELRATRRRLQADALATDALLVATHIAGAGRLAQGPAGAEWIAV